MGRRSKLVVGPNRPLAGREYPLLVRPRAHERDVFEIFEELGQRNFLERATLLYRIAVFAFIAQIAARFNAAGAFA